MGRPPCTIAAVQELDPAQEVDLLVAQVPEGMRLQSGDDVLHGQGEWLFERDGGRRLLAQMRGDLILSVKAVRRWVFVLESRLAWLRSRGCAYVFAVAPSEYALLPEKLPDGVALAMRRPVTQLRHWLVQAASPAQVVYPLEELQVEAEERVVWTSHDSRWNAQGAYLGYRSVLNAIPEEVDVRRVEPEDLVFVWREAAGDLSHRIAPGTKDQTLLGWTRWRSARLVWDNQVEGEGRMLITQCEPAPETSCVVFGDWSSYRMLTYLSEGFSRMVFVHLGTLDHELVEAERPDVVLQLVDESALIDVPPDVEAPTAREVAARKLSRGPEPMPHLAHLWGQLAPDAATPTTTSP